MLYSLDINIATGGISTREKILALKYVTASRAEPQSITSRLRMSVQQAKPALPVELLCEQLPKVYVFSADKIFTTLCSPFLN